MNEYRLIQKKSDCTKILGIVKIGTLKQATRKLYRIHNIIPSEAKSLGFAVEFLDPKKEPNGK